jgi:hypothetical protein
MIETPENPEQTEYPRYWCWTRGCTNPVGVSADELHEQFTHLLGVYEPSTDLMVRLPDIAPRNWENRRDSLIVQRRQLSERQSKNDTLNRNTITAKLEGKLSDEDFNTMKESIRRKRRPSKNSASCWIQRKQQCRN